MNIPICRYIISCVISFRMIISMTTFYLFLLNTVKYKIQLSSSLKFFSFLCIEIYALTAQLKSYSSKAIFLLIILMVRQFCVILRLNWDLTIRARVCVLILVKTEKHRTNDKTKDTRMCKIQMHCA